jgi:hypothetical protein
LGFSGFMGILSTCTKEIKTKLTKFDFFVCGDYEDCRLGGYDAVWPGINLLTCRRKVLYPYHTPKTSVNFYHTARCHVTAEFNFNNLSVCFDMVLGKFVTAFNYTKLVNGKVSPSSRVATLVSGTGCRILWKLAVLPRLQAMFHRHFAANCVHFSLLSWWLNRNHLLKLRWCNVMKASDVCHCFYTV